MAFTGTSIFGGFEDPEETGPTILDAVYEYEDFADQIIVDLIDDTPFISLDDLKITVQIEGAPVSFNELTGNGTTELNIEYSSPNTTSVVGLTVVSSINGTNTEGNIYITGNIQNAFPDKYWEYTDFKTGSSVAVSSSIDIPDSDVGLHTYKPSFMRYVNITFSIEAVYDSATITGNFTKKVVNDWEINRLAVLSQVSRETEYRSNNYPRA